MRKMVVAGFIDQREYCIVSGAVSTSYKNNYYLYVRKYWLEAVIQRKTE